jgi:DHA2 family multidrug resistance protein
VLGAHVSAYDQAAGGHCETSRAKLVSAGFAARRGTTARQALIYATVQKQSALLAFLDVFWLLGLLALAAIASYCSSRAFDTAAGGGRALNSCCLC